MGNQKEIRPDRETQWLGFGTSLNAPYVLQLTNSLQAIKGGYKLYKFDGVDDYVEINSTSFNTSHILKAKITPVTEVGLSGIIVLNDYFGFLLNGSSIRYTLQFGGATKQAIASNIFREGEEHTIKCIYDSIEEKMKIFVDDIEQTLTTEDDVSGLTLDSHSISYIGKRHDGFNIKGNIEYVQVYNDATQTSLLVDYDLVNNATLGKDNVIDLSGNGNTGTSYGKGEFTRSTTGTVTDNNGNIVECAIDEPRYEGARRISEGVWSNQDVSGNSIPTSTLKGILVEEEKTNIILHSENEFESGAYSKVNCTMLDSQIISPDGNLTGSLATDDDTNDKHIIYQVVNNVPIGTVTMSVYLKKGTHRYIFIKNTVNGGSKRYGIIIDMNDFSVVYDNVTGGATGGSYNVKRLDNEWCRVEVSVDQETVSTCYPVVGFSDSATPTVNDKGEPIYSGTGTNFYVFGLQLEEGPFATSYIKTESTTVTRTKDILSYDITDIITQGQGWLYAEFECVGQKGGTYVRVIEMNDGTNDNRILLYLRPTGLIACGVVNSGVFQALINTTQKEFNILHKVLITYKDNLVRWFVDGVKINEDTLCTIPINLTTLRIGSDYNNGNQLNGTIKNVKYGKNPDLTDDEGIRRTQ